MEKGNSRKQCLGNKRSVPAANVCVAVDGASTYLFLLARLGFHFFENDLHDRERDTVSALKLSGRPKKKTARKM
jgi:hypothetical protein